MKISNIQQVLDLKALRGKIKAIGRAHNAYDTGCSRLVITTDNMTLVSHRYDDRETALAPATIAAIQALIHVDLKRRVRELESELKGLGVELDDE